MAQTTRPPRRPATRDALPEQGITREVLIEKYAKGDEASAADVRARVARALAGAEAEGKRAQWEARFLETQERGFIPAGRINSAAGTSLTATLINCFVQPVGDSITETVDGRPGIYVALAEAAETMRRGEHPPIPRSRTTGRRRACTTPGRSRASWFPSPTRPRDGWRRSRSPLRRRGAWSRRPRRARCRCRACRRPPR